MTQLVHRTVPATIGVALLGAILIRDGQSLVSSLSLAHPLQAYRP